MPIHDWSRIPARLFHDFHQTWSIQIKITLNAGILPKGISALVEQRSGPRESDVLALERHGKPPRTGLGSDGDVATTEPPVTRFVSRTTKEIYAARANRIVIKHHLGRTIAVIEIGPPWDTGPGILGHSRLSVRVSASAIRVLPDRYSKSRSPSRRACTLAARQLRPSAWNRARRKPSATGRGGNERRQWIWERMGWFGERLR
jgi:hypothetical protein